MSDGNEQERDAANERDRDAFSDRDRDPLDERDRSPLSERDSYAASGPAPGAPNDPAAGRLSHIDAEGAARMVDVGDKPPTRRRAVAEGWVTIGAAAAQAISESRVAKGNVLEVARLAGIGAAKRTHELIPLCHVLPLDHVQIDLAVVGERVRIVVSASAFARTGVEMEAMTAASVAALTVYDMLKAVEKGIEIGPIRLLEKSGGKNRFRRS